MPVFDAVYPVWITALDHGPVLILVEGDDEVGVLEIRILHLLGESRGGIVLQGEVLEPFEGMQ